VKGFSGFEGVLRKRINSSRHFRHGFLVARANPRHRRRVATRNCEIPRTNTQRKLLLTYLVNCLFSLASRPSKIHIITVRTERHRVALREIGEKGERFEDRALKGIRLLRWWSIFCFCILSWRERRVAIFPTVGVEPLGMGASSIPLSPGTANAHDCVNGM